MTIDQHNESDDFHTCIKESDHSINEDRSDTIYSPVNSASKVSSYQLKHESQPPFQGESLAKHRKSPSVM